VALTILGPIIVVILLFHITMNPEGIGLALVVAVLEIFLIYAHWHHFRPIYNGHNNNHLNNHSI
jgi:hypothetical protein